MTGPLSPGLGAHVGFVGVRSPLRWIAIALTLFGVGLAGCGGSGPLPPVTAQPPVATTLSWFRAINSGNDPLALAHFAPGSRDQMEWSDFGSISFTDVRCHVIGESASSSNVGCRFQVPNAPPDMQGVTGWSVHLERTQSGPWLITTYGQG